MGDKDARARLVAAALVAGISIAAYINTLWCGFVYDDASIVKENRWIADLGNIPAFFTSDAWSLAGKFSSNYYRPLLYVFYSIEYALFGAEPWGFHLGNVLLNAGTCVLLFLVICELLGSVRTSGESGAPIEAYAFAGAAVFALHPMQTESVAWIASATGLLFLFFGLFSIYLYIRSQDGWGVRYALSVFFFLLSLFSKETAVAVPVLIVAYDCFMAGRFRAMRYAAYLAAACLYFFIRLNVLDYIRTSGEYLSLTNYECFVNAVVLFAGYFYKLVLPVNQNAVYEFHPSVSLLGWKEAAAVLFAAAYACCIYAARGAWRFALIWMALPLMPVLYVKFFGSTVFAERYLQATIAGFAFMVSLAGLHLGRRRVFGGRTGAVLFAVFMTAALVYAVLAVKRIAIWKSDVTFWTSVAEASNENAIAYYNLGRAYIIEGDAAAAEMNLKKAVSLRPDHAPSRMNLGVALMINGKLDEAVEEELSAIRLAPGESVPYRNLAAAYVKKGMLKEAEKTLLKGIEFNPRHSDMHRELAAVYDKMGRKAEAGAYEDAARRLKAEPGR